MPVVTLYYERLTPMLGGNIDRGRVVERLPYLGLDIEDEGEGYVKVEYNPNRPDYSTDFGIARGLKGLLGLEVGPPKYELHEGETRILVDDKVQGVRPFIVGLSVRGLNFDDESLRQLISMQEDLHAGIGRQRRKASIGLHNSDVISPPFRYTVTHDGFRFAALGEEEPTTIKEVLQRTEPGVKYGHILSGFSLFPLLLDSKGEVLSFPPIINGELTRVTTQTRNLFVDVTGTDLRPVEDALAVVAAALADMGGSLEKVKVLYKGRTMVTPEMKTTKMRLDLSMTRRLLGLRLKGEETVDALSKSRIGAKLSSNSLLAEIPRYRVDIMHPVDLVEEIAIGYGLDKFQSTLPKSSVMGKKGMTQGLLDISREVLVGLGLTETMSFSLVDEKLLYEMVKREPRTVIKVEHPKSKEHEVLRDSLIPPLLSVLSRNIHEDYPHRLFEIARVFMSQDGNPPIREEYHVGAVFAHSKANYTEAKSYLVSFLSQALGLDCETSYEEHPSLLQGRSASVISKGMKLGYLGEIEPDVLERFGLRVPVSCFELNLDPALLPGS